VGIQASVIVVDVMERALIADLKLIFRRLALNTKLRNIIIKQHTNFYVIYHYKQYALCLCKYVVAFAIRLIFYSILYLFLNIKLLIDFNVFAKCFVRGFNIFNTRHDKSFI